MDAELRELERLFEAAQQAKSTARLSERSVVELVLKLQEIGLLDTDLLHSASGKEYVTQEQLRHEIHEEIKRVGRVSIIDLANLTGVDSYHCEKQVKQIVAENPRFMIVQGEIIADSYWDSLAEEVNETLKEASQVSVGELARRYNLSAELLTGILSSRLGTLLHGKLEGSQLYTPEYVARVKATMRGALRALTVPTSLTIVWTSLQNQLRNGEEGVAALTGEGSLFNMVLKELIAEGAAKGSIRGGGSVWSPAVFAESQRESIEALFSQNAYVTYDSLKKLQVPQPKEYLQAKYPDGIALDFVYVHSSFISLIDTAVEEAISGVGWIDAVDVVPFAFGSFDTGKLLLLCPSVHNAIKESKAEILAETCVVSSPFIMALLERFHARLRDNVITPRLPPKEEAAAGEQKQNLVDNTKPSKARKRESKPKEGVDDDEDNVDGKPTRGKKRSAKAKGFSKRDVPSEEKEAAEEASVPREDQMAQSIIEWFPEVEAAAGGGLSSSLAARLRPELLSYVTSLKRSLLKAKTDDRKKILDGLQKKLDKDYVYFQLYSKALDMFEDDKALEAVLHRHLLRTTCAEIADSFIEAKVLEHRLETLDERQELSPKPFSTVARLTLARSLHRSLSPMAVEMVESLEGKNVAAFESALEALARESGLRLKKLDKKGERSLLHVYIKDLAEQVEQETDAIGLLPKVVALMYAQIHGRALQAPGRAISAAVTRLKAALSEDSFCVLEDYHAATVSILAAPSPTLPTNIHEQEQARNKRESLEARMPALRAALAAAVSCRNNQKQKNKS